MMAQHRSLPDDSRSSNAQASSFSQPVTAMSGGGQHPVIDRPVLIPDFPIAMTKP
jgi:hypothetical protein